jgi:hypothetical protein
MTPFQQPDSYAVKALADVFKGLVPSIPPKVCLHVYQCDDGSGAPVGLARRVSPNDHDVRIPSLLGSSPFVSVVPHHLWRALRRANRNRLIDVYLQVVCLAADEVGKRPANPY